MKQSRAQHAKAPHYAGLAVGYSAVFVGGIIAALTSPLGITKGSWLAAYLVLVAGLSQLLLSHQQQLLLTPPRPARWLWTQLLSWMVGNALVIAGSLNGLPLLVGIGGAGLLLALLIALAHTTEAPIAWRAWALRLFYGAVIISVPIGITLAHLRAS